MTTPAPTTTTAVPQGDGLTRTPEAIALSAWQRVFGTTQLTHAKARLERLERDRTRLVEALKKCEYLLPNAEGRELLRELGELK